MLQYALTFAIIALIAGILGFGVLGGALAWLARACLLIFAVLFIVSLVNGGRQNSAV